MRGRGRNKAHRKKKKKHPDAKGEGAERDDLGASAGTAPGETQEARVPIIAMDYFFMSDGKTRSTIQKGRSMITNELRRRLKVAMIPANGGREELIRRYDEFVKEAPKTLKTNLVKLAKNNGAELGFLS